MTAATELQQIPVAVWVAIISACSALLGVFVGNWLTARERQRDREVALKREAFMRTGKAVMALHRMLMELADLERSDPDISKKMQELTAQVSSVDLLGNASTVAATRSFLLSLTGALVAIRLQRLHIRPLSKSGQELIDKILAEISSWEKSQDQAARDQKYNKLWSMIHADTKAFETNFKATIELIKLCAAKSKEIGELVPPIIFALREELGVPVDEQEYLKVWQESSRREQEIAEGVIGATQRLYRRPQPAGESRPEMKALKRAPIRRCLIGAAMDCSYLEPWILRADRSLKKGPAPG